MNKITQLMAGVLLASGSFSLPVYAEPHDAAPMLGSSAKKSTQAQERKSQQKLKQFYDAYKDSGSPSIAIFWNRAFTDKVSQWESQRREIVTGEKAINATDLLKKNGDLTQEEIDQGFKPSTATPSGGNIGTYDRVIKGGSKILATKQVENRVKAQDRAGFNETEQFTFSSAFVQAFIQQEVKVLDRAAIIRIIERDMVREAGAEMVADVQKIETEALVGYAELLAEVLWAEDQVNYLVTVKEVATGRVLTSFKSNARGEERKKWATTSSGYQKQKSYEFNTLEEIGRQLATETMSHLSGVIGEL